jgi:hypothetical protein
MDASAGVGGLGKRKENRKAGRWKKNESTHRIREKTRIEDATLERRVRGGGL